MKKVALTISILLFTWVLNYASDFKVSSKLKPVQKSGYYNIQLNPAIISFSNDDYSDIRLYNSRGEEIPYIFNEEKPATATSGFRDYPVLENQYLESKKQTRVVVQNINKKVLSSLVLIVRNSVIEKEITLKGSDNKKDWYIIQKGNLNNLGNYSETTQAFELEFPKSDYEYFEITTNDKRKDPVQFVKIGYYDSRVVQGMYSEVAISGISQRDSSNKKSYITISFGQNNEVSRLIFKFSGPELFRRDAIIGHYNFHNNNKYFETFGSLELLSSKQAVWESEKLRTSDLVLVIENLGNMPLKIESVKAFQLNKHLVAKLEAGETYFVKSGNSEINNPEYDLKYFADSIPDSISMLNTNEILISDSPKHKNSKTFLTQTVLWVVIILVIGLLGFLSIRMIREMGKKS